MDEVAGVSDDGFVGERDGGGFCGGEGGRGGLW